MMVERMYPREKRLLLIEPPFYRLFNDRYALQRYPLSLGYLAGAVKSTTEWGVLVYNADFVPNSETLKLEYLAGEGFQNYIKRLNDLSSAVWQNVQGVISDYMPTAVGISAKSQNYKSALNVAKLVKVFDPNIPVIVGGPHPSMVKGRLLNARDIDVCVMGEGERTIVELLNAIGNDNKMTDVAGVIFRNAAGDIVENQPRTLIDNLDTLCFPHMYARDVLKDYALYPKTAFRNIFTVRGCPYSCIFCGSRNIWTQRVRYRSVMNVVKEIRSLNENGIKDVHFDDDTFGVNKEYIKELCMALIAYCPKLSWSCELHVRLVTDDVVALMKKAGCIQIQVGIESGNNDILKRIRKGITIEMAEKACEIIRKHGITLQAFFMIGFPFDTAESITDTAMAMKRISADGIAYSIFTPYPGTEAFRISREMGLVNDDFDVSLFNHQSPLNNFCATMEHKTFRALASRIENLVDRRNMIARFKNLFSRYTLKKVRDNGLKRSAHILTKMVSDIICDSFKRNPNI